MTDPRAIRARLGLSQQELGRALGYTGKPQSLRTAVMKFESGVRPLPSAVERLLIMFDRHGVPEEWR